MVEIKLVALRGGTVALHDARRKRRWEVELAPFEIAPTAVTEGLSADLRGTLLTESLRPIAKVSWEDALRMCNGASAREGLPLAYEFTGDDVRWVTQNAGYRLPTEAEWEFACRAGTVGPRYADLADIAWTASDHIERTQAVGLKNPNEFGLFDMLGNVWEWCWDYLDPARYGNYRVFRGGGFADQQWSVRASVRRGGEPEIRHDDLGFRMARGGFSSCSVVQGWSASLDADRATVLGPRPVGWTPLGR